MDTRQPMKMHLRQVSSSIIGGICQILEKKCQSPQLGTFYQKESNYF